MIEKIDIVEYRKLKNITLDFSKNVNIIAGTNGTCKSSILHIISNSFKKPVKAHDPAYDVIDKLNKLTNPKIEALTRSEKRYNDPAKNIKGTLFTTYYKNDLKLNFRRHNSSKEGRFAIKPTYSKNKKEALPSIPIIYLGLFRLFPFGEFSADDKIAKISQNLPTKNLKLLIELFNNFTHYKIDINSFNNINMGGIKNRPEFITNSDGIDSNTISAGEDNLFILLLALVSLKNYYDEHEGEQASSILLIDEFDASLHPAYQIKLLNLLIDYSKKYNIQVFFTTHSLFLLKELNNNCNLIYLIDNVDYVHSLPDPDYYKVEMLLNEMTRSEIYLYNQIPIFTEDAEAREFLKLLFTNYQNQTSINLHSFFHIVDTVLSSETIKHLANDDKLLKSTLRSIFILDGDQSINAKNLNNHLIILPGNLSPEELAFTHAQKLDSKFWKNNTVISQGYTKKKYEEIKSEIDKFYTELEENKKQRNTAQNENKNSKIPSTKGRRREFNKRMFNSHKMFWKYVLKDWIIHHESEINNFFHDLNITFRKTSDFHGINSNSWLHSSISEVAK